VSLRWVGGVLFAPQRLNEPDLIVLIGSAVVLFAALAIRLRRGPPTSVAGLFVVASLPLFVASIAIVVVRAQLGLGAAPDFVLEPAAAYDAVGVWRSAAHAASACMVLAFLVGATFVLDWEPRPGAVWRVGLAVALVMGFAVLLLPFDEGLALEIVRLPVRYADLWLRSGRRAGVRASVWPITWVAIVAIVLLGLGRARDRRRMGLATLMAALAVVTAAYSEALIAEHPGFFCFTRPPGPASLVASAQASHWVTMLVGLASSVPVLALGTALTMSGSSGSRRSVGMALVLGQAAVAPGVLFTVWDDAAHLRATADPAAVSAQAGVTLPSATVPESLMGWGHDWPTVVVDSLGVRTRAGEVRWDELDFVAGRERLRSLVPTPQRVGPNGVVVYGDAALPMRRLRALARVAELDGLAVVVDAPSEVRWPTLSIAARETRRVTVWICLCESRCEARAPRWLRPDIHRDERPTPETLLGDWLDAALARAAGGEPALLVLRDPP